jgi:hypothetical protein
MTITIAAAPRGVRIGFTVAAAGSRQLTVSVLPKPWRPNSQRTLRASGNERAITLYETDRLHVANPSTAVEQLLVSCLQVRRDNQGDAEAWQSGLLAPAVAPSTAELSDSRPVAEDDGAVLTDLLLLFEQLELLFPETEEVGGSAAYSPLHRPLLCRRFLDEVFALANSARRGYQTVTEVGTTVRGRVHSSSVARYRMTGDPRLAYSYDALTESTVLLGIVAATLESIADGVGLRSPFSGRYSTVELRHDAVRLRRVFSEVVAVPWARARQIGRRLRLSRLDQPWSVALQTALTLLDMAEYGTRHVDGQLADAVELSVPTDKLWERIVTAAMRRAGFAEVFSQGAQPVSATSDPWLAAGEPQSGTRPDNIGRYGDQLWVVDAKYKTPAAGSGPSRDDQYQMFAYSHLVRLDDQAVTHVALVYPGSGASRVWRRGRTPGEDDCLLLSLKIPFPRPGEVRSATTWQHYLDRAGETLRAGVIAAVTGEQASAR